MASWLSRYSTRLTGRRFCDETPWVTLDSVVVASLIYGLTGASSSRKIFGTNISVEDSLNESAYYNRFD